MSGGQVVMGRVRGPIGGREVDESEAVTVVIPLPRTGPPRTAATEPAEGVPGAAAGGDRGRLRGAAVWLTAALAIVMLTASVVVVARALTTPVPVADTTSPVAPAPSATAVAPAPVEDGADGASAAREQSACPSRQEVLAVFADAAPQYGTGARAISEVTCADGFAVMSLRSPTTPDGLRTIYAIGPPLRHLGSGTGPICSDDGSEGVTVPRSAASTLDCVTTGAAESPDTASGTDEAAGGASSPGASAGSRSGADPYGCLAERAAQERSFDTDEPMSNAEVKCNYNYGPTLPTSREQCWLAHHDLQDGSGFIDERARRDYRSGCSRFGY